MWRQTSESTAKAVLSLLSRGYRSRSKARLAVQWLQVLLCPPPLPGPGPNENIFAYRTDWAARRRARCATSTVDFACTAM